MKILIGTTNPSKIIRFKDFLSGCNVEFLTLTDLGITCEPEEQGKTPEQNAAIKARFYGQYFDAVICNDSGLYLDSLQLEDPRQPGLNIRTPGNCRRLDDEEMIRYYSELVRSLGGRTLAYYMDGIAVYNRGTVSTFMENSEATRASAFYMVDTPSQKRQPGWPLNSLSLNRNTLTYFSEHGNSKYDSSEDCVILGQYRNRVVAFLKEALGLNPS